MFREFFAEAINAAEWQLIILATIILFGPLVAKRFRLPGMIGLVLGGLALGPYGLGWLAEGSLDAIGGIGLLFLMFMAGAELDLNLFQRFRSAAVSFGLLTFAAPFLLGLLAALYLDLGLAAAILMGSVWASHTLVAYPEVRQAGLSGNKAVATAVGATVITDTLALMVLAVISGTTGSSEGGQPPILIVVRLTVGLVLLVLYCMVLVPRMARWFFAGPGQGHVQRFVFIVAAMASAGLLAAAGGIEGIVGAFFAGLGLNRLIPNEGQLMERLEFYSSSYFIPAFLISVGMLINPAVLFNLQTILIAALFFVALAAGKLLAAVLAGRRYRFSHGEVGMIFSLTIAQAAATLASTLIGYELGLFGDQIVNAVLLVVLVSLVLTSLGVRAYSRRIEPEAVVLKPVGKSVVVPVLSSPALERLMSLAAGIAFPDAGIVLPVAVVPEYEANKARAQAEELLRQAEEHATAAAADVAGVLRIDATLQQGILREAAEHAASLILIEWQGQPDVQEIVFGHLVDYIGARSPIPAAAVRFSDRPVQRVVLAPGTGMTSSGDRVDVEIAADIASRLAQAWGQTLHLFASGGTVPEGRALPKDAEITTLEPGLDAVMALLQPGDLVVVPAAVVQRLVGSGALTMAKVVDHLSIIVAAGPHRLSLTAAPATLGSEAILNLGTGSMASV
jgi:Kef-type K+ transport system membrane component KefB